MMIIKRILSVLIVLGLLYLLFAYSLFVYRLPSYSIQTTGKLYVVNKLSRNIQVFNLLNGKEITKIPVNMQSHEAITTMGQNRVVVTNYGGVTNNINIIGVINTKTNDVEKILDVGDGIRTNGIVGFPEEANKIAVVDYVSNELLVLNIEADSIEKRIETKQKKSHLVVLHPTKPLAYVTNMKSNTISVINLVTNSVVKVVPCGLAPESVDITPDGSEVWVSNIRGNSITVINTSTNEVVNTLSTGNEPVKIKISKDGNYCLAANAEDGTISVYDQSSKKRIKTIHLHGKATFLERILYHTPRPVNILMHPNGLYAFVSNSNASKIEVIDMKTLEIVSSIGTGKTPDALAFVK